jgi:hypothetical protein
VLREPGGGPINGNQKGMNAATNGDNEDVRKLNPYLIDPSGTALHVDREGMTQDRQEKRNDIGGRKDVRDRRYPRS